MSKLLLWIITLLFLASAAKAGVISKLPTPVRLKSISIPAHLTHSQNAISYTDCVEISLLRFIQAMIIDLNQPETVDLKHLQRLNPAPWIFEFFLRNPHISSTQWLTETEEGQKLRNDWAILLTRLPSKNIVYVREGQFELEANIGNFFEVLNLAFPDFRTSITPDPKSFENVSKYFSRPGFDLNVTLKHHGDSNVDSDLLYRETTFDVHVNLIPVYEIKSYEYINPENKKTQTGHTEMIDLRPIETPSDLTETHFPSPIIFKKVVISRENGETSLEYTDCVETSFLRVLQVLLSDLQDPSTINLTRLRSMTHDAGLIGFFTAHPRIHRNTFYYDTNEGQELRTEWAIFLSNRGFIYNKGEFEVRSTLKNVFSLFHYFFPSIQFQNPIPLTHNQAFYQSELNKISDYFSYPGFRVGMLINKHEDVNLDEGLIYRVTLINILLNSHFGYQWDVHEFLQDKTRVTGHAELYRRFTH